MFKKLLPILSLCVLLIGCSTKSLVIPTLDEKPSYNKHTVNELKNGVNLYFVEKSTQLESKYIIYLETLAKVLERNPHYIVEIEGHTDSRGSVAANKRVSTNRANAVRNQLLIDYQVNPEQIKAIGVGSDKPIDSNATEEGRANNRRASAILKIQ